MNWYKRALKEDKGFPEGDKWIPVESSFISHVAYYEPLKMFEIKLMNGQTYSFSGVPKNTFNRFMKAKSKGEFFNKVIRPNYTAR